MQSFSDASLTTCPACSGALRKVFSSVGIVFKGSGFYRTDSRSGAGSTVTGGDTPAKNGAAKTDGGGEPTAPGRVRRIQAGKDSESSSTSSSSSELDQHAGRRRVLSRAPAGPLTDVVPESGDRRVELSTGRGLSTAGPARRRSIGASRPTLGR